MTVNFVVPQLGESVVEATVGRWHKAEGESVAVGEVLVELETDKVNLEVGASHQGVLARIERGEGENVKVGDVLAVIEETAPAPQPDMRSAEPPAPAAAAVPIPQAPALPRATPTARRLALEKGVDLTRLSAAAKGAAITPDDIREYSSAQEAVTDARSAEASRTPPAPAAEEDHREERVRMSRRRLTIATRLVQALHTAAPVTTFNDIDMGGVMELRRKHKDVFKERHGVGLGIVSFFVKAAVAALRDFPRLNAEIQGDEMVLKHYYDIGVAVGAAEGLVVPVLHDADKMSYGALEQAIKRFMSEAAEGKLTLDDLRGGTFTISNGGVFGSLLSTPILNPPQVGILGLHRIEDRPVVLAGKIEVRPMMYAALSYDHRIVDGLEAVQFLKRIKELIEDPESLFLES